MLTTKIDTFNISHHSNCLGERKNWVSVSCFVPTAAARTIFSSILWETISPIRFSRYFNFIIFRTKHSFYPNHQAFSFCSCKYYVWFEKRTNKDYLPLQNFRMKPAQQSFKYDFFYIWRNQCSTFLLSRCFLQNWNSLSFSLHQHIV